MSSCSGSAWRWLVQAAGRCRCPEHAMSTSKTGLNCRCWRPVNGASPSTVAARTTTSAADDCCCSPRRRHQQPASSSRNSYQPILAQCSQKCYINPIQSDVRLANRPFLVCNFWHSGDQGWAPECHKVNPNMRLSYRRETRATLCITWNVVLPLYE